MATYIRIFSLITVGVIAGIFYASIKDTSLPPGVDEQPGGTLPTTLQPQVSVHESNRLADLETELASLKARIAVIEAVTASATISTNSGDDINSVQSPPSPPVANATPLPVIEGLIAAGVDPHTAEEIVRAESRIQLKRLELRDAAMRESYLGTDRFREEMQQLSASEVNIRDQVSEESYDRYLYHTGQANRILVDSVIMGSAAEEAGMQRGDVILSYENQRLFDWNDLREATSAGERGELVSIRIDRSGSVLTMTIPRGPLGVGLNSIRQDPESG